MACDLDSAASRATIVRKEINRCSGAHTRNRAYAFEHSRAKAALCEGSRYCATGKDMEPLSTFSDWNPGLVLSKRTKLFH